MSNGNARKATQLGQSHGQRPIEPANGIQPEQAVRTSDALSAASVAAATGGTGEPPASIATGDKVGGSGGQGGGPLRVLVIEDEVLIGMLLEQILLTMGHDVIGVESTEQGAVQAAAEIRPGLILVDERLIAGSGQAAIEQILRGGFIPHIWMSGASLRHLRLAPGIAALQKPFTEHALGLAIAQVRMAAPPPGMAGSSIPG